MLSLIHRKSSTTGATRLALLSAASFLTLGSSPAEIILGPRTATPAVVHAGEQLLRELNCLTCHSGNMVDRRNYPHQPGPVLGAQGQRITPQYLRQWLSSPHATKPGTPMPDLLHGLPESERHAAAEALTHFLVSLQPEVNQPGTAAEDFLLKQGETLFHTVGCVACHAPQIPPSQLPGSMHEDSSQSIDPNLLNDSVPLTGLARKTTVSELARFLLDPVKVRPSGRMPSLALTPAEATAISMYLLRDQIPASDTSKMERVQGLRYAYYDQGGGTTEALNKLTPVSTGVVGKFDSSPRKKENNFGFRFSGSIHIPQDGEYTFYTLSDDGSRLFIGDKLVVNNDGDHAPEERSGKLYLQAGEHPIQVTFFQAGGGHEFKVLWQGPGFNKKEIQPEVLSHLGQIMIPLDSEEFTPNPELINKGRTLFGNLGCVACHQVPGERFTLPSRKAFAALNPGQGCLSENPGPQIPRFAFSPQQREALKTLLQIRTGQSKPHSSEQIIAHTITSLNCNACHTRDAKGGPVESRLEYFRTLGDAEMGDEGRIPPHLTAVGAKLRPEWMQEVLLKNGTARPYMATRMPQYGERNVGHLPALFDKTDAVPTPKPDPEVTQREAKLGRRLVGVGGLTCVSCHTFGDFKSLGIPAVDLTTVTKRLKFDWFERYLIDPASLRPGTRMPTFWPEGKAVNQEILDGDTASQIRAIWAYLSAGRQADIPPGLIQGTKELVPETDPIIYRNFIQGAGTRAIGVGYPEKVNLAWDANEMRPAMIWQGAFIDAARHSTGRGEGFEPPLGHNVLHLPPGPPFAALQNLDAPWPKETGRKAGLRMGGYSLDQHRRPTFFFHFEEADVEESFEPVEGDLDPFFIRRLDIRSKEPLPNLWFRAAVGNSIKKLNDSTFTLNNKVTIRFSDPGAIIRQSQGQWELLFPVTFKEGRAHIQQEIIW